MNMNGHNGLIGTCPFHRRAPLDYRYALDAVMSVPEMRGSPLVRWNIAALAEEVDQRFPRREEPPPANAAVTAALWGEPLGSNWRDELQTLTSPLKPGAPLVVVASRPLARLLPERAAWKEQPLGLTPGSLFRLQRTLMQHQCPVEATYGIHSILAIGLHLLSRRAEQWGRPDMGDRLHFLARRFYCVGGPLAGLSTVALIVARKQNEAQPIDRLTD